MKRIMLAVNNWIFGDATLEAVIKRAAACGFDGIELVGEPAVYRAEKVDALLADSPLRICSICGMFPGPAEDDLRALCHSDPRERAKAVDYVKACIDLAAGVGARSVLVAPSLVGKPVFFADKQTDLDYAADSLRTAAAYAVARNIILHIEPINRYEVCLVNSVADAIALARKIDSPNVRVMGDTFHMQLEEWEGIPNAIRRAGQYWFQHLHVADNTRQAPGMGTLPWREIIRALIDIDYEGAISYEPLPKGKAPYDARNGNIPAEKLDAELKLGVAYLRNEMEICAKQWTA